MSTTLVTWLTKIHSGYQAVQAFDKHVSAAQRASAGKKPYPQSPAVESQMSKLRDTAKQLAQLSSSGIGKPEQELDWTTLQQMIAQLEGDDQEREKAVRSFYAIQMPRLAFVEDAKKLAAQAESLSKEAATRRDAAVRIRDKFSDLVEKFPDPAGGSIKVALFGCYEAFESASGALATLASSAEESGQRIEKDLKPVVQKNKEFDQAFRAAYDASKKAKKT